jgi:hypothetical protein
VYGNHIGITLEMRSGEIERFAGENHVRISEDDVFTTARLNPAVPSSPRSPPIDYLSAFSDGYIARTVIRPVVRDHHVRDTFHRPKPAQECRQPTFLVPGRNDYCEPGSRTGPTVVPMGTVGWCHETLLKP